jgi:hypothetical protein
MDRRNFVQAAKTVVGAVAAKQLVTPLLHAEVKRPENGDMIYRTLGRTGERIWAIGLGGFHIGILAL